MKKIKILVVSNYNDYHSVRPEAETFVSLHKLGYEVTIMTFGDSEYAEIFRSKGIRVIDHHPTKRYQRESIQRIKAELIAGKYDAMHLYNNKSIINGLLAARGLKVKVIGYRGSTLNFSWYNPFNYIKHLSPRLDYVICNSVGVAEKYRKHPFFKNSKAIVINKGHKLDWYTDIQPVVIRSKYEIGEETTIFILVATDRTMKGVKYLCQAVNLLPENTNFTLLMMGKGMDSRSYRAILERGPHSDKVRTQSHNPDALSYVAGADVFVLPSIKGESITKAVLEAMSLGICPLITDIAGNVELVEHGKNGLVVQHGDPRSLSDAMLQLCKDTEAKSAYGRASKDRIANRLSHQSSVEKYTELYDEIYDMSHE